MRRLLAVAFVLGAGALAVVLAGASGEKEGKTYQLLFDNAFGLTEGGDLKVAGVRAGRTTAFKLTENKPPKAVVEAELTQPGVTDLREDASCSIKPQSLIGEYFVDCQPGTSKQKLTKPLPVEQTESTIPADLLNNVLRRPYRERLRLIIAELGTGLAGRPQDLQEVLKRAHPGLRETSKTLAILGRQNKTIKSFLRDSDKIIAALEGNKADVNRFVVEAGETAEISATRSQDIRRSFQRLPTFLDELRPTMVRLGELTDAQTPLLADLRRAAPSLDRFLTLLGPFSQASRPAFRALGRASVTGEKAVRTSAEEINELKRGAADAPELAKPLRQFLQTLDDRDRAVYPDRRAAATAPPKPDKTADRPERGFTGFEAIWNYPFWQTLSINGLDDVGHVLRVGAVFDEECRQYIPDKRTSENAALFDRCNQFLGPYQPGVIQPDPTEGAGAASRSGRRGAAVTGPTPAARVGERRGAGEPEAAPLPGQRDISKPQITLPPQVQQLLDQLPQLGKGKLGGGGSRGSGGAGSEQLLDFLFRP